MMALLLPRRPLRALFIHQNFPGQWAHLAPALAQRAGVKVWAVGEKPGHAAPGVEYIAYGAPKGAGEATHRYLRSLEASTRRGQHLANRLVQLRDKGMRPDIIVCHPGWGEGLFLKDVFPQARTLFYWEFYYNSVGQDLGFDPTQPVGLDDAARIRMLNATQLISLQAADWGLSPTRWQWSRYPDWARRRITCLHEGVDTQRCAPDPQAVFTTPQGRRFDRGEEVISYVARNLEPYRGFPTMMRALPRLQRERPNLHTIIVGGNEVSYGKKPEDAENWKAKLLAELGPSLDLSRIHFTGRVPHDELHNLFRITRAHIYLTYPFVLSWSMLEAMACGALIIGSDTSPVTEVLEHGRNGLVVPFFDPDALARQVSGVLADPSRHGALAATARADIIARYDLRTRCLPRQLDLVEKLAAGGEPEAEPLAV
ncbi:glycosyltransferase family 4 protein [Falsiroseomonas sp. HC035]|uniref:glycosyltransferase family 4 protein n=1 Tax=Falsiroseomonas sp. HC035 TaxID=3390999 RepID=UPI003D31321E